jgi:hypothetical protein
VRRWRTLPALALAVASLTLCPAAAQAGHNRDQHSSNMSLIGQFNDGGTYRQGSDIAIWENLAAIGNLDPGGFRLMDISNPRGPRELGQFACTGTQSDTAIWGDIVVVSVDVPMSSPNCDATAQRADTGTTWEGLRIVSIADRANPRQLAAVKTDCGSHTHTLLPDEANNRLLVYVHSYPLNPQGVNCTAASHRKVSVVEVPLSNPAASKVASTFDVSPTVGCHDSTVLIPRKLVGAACISESQMWDVSADPLRPRILSHITNPAINIHHSTTFTWDGRMLVIGDELAGATVTPGCGPGGEHVPFGALWFYDVSDPRNPRERAAWRIPQTVASVLCTAHNFNTIPLLSGRYVLASAWYDGGTTVTDFTDPANPRQLGHYIPAEGGQGTAWSSYWHNGLIYSNNYETTGGSRSRGFDVFSIAHSSLTDFVRLPRLNPQTMEPLPGIGLTRRPRRPSCRDRIRPRSSFSRRGLRRSPGGITVSGRASDRGCGRRRRGRVSHVIVAVARRYGQRRYRCSYLRRLPGRARTDRLTLGRRGSCRKKTYVVAGGTAKWRYRIKARLPRGLYNIRTRAVDSSANFERRRDGRGKRVNVLWFRVR